MKKGSIQEEDIIFVNIYAPNIGVPKYRKQILTDIKGEIDENAIIVDFTTSLTSVDRSPRQKINKATDILNDTIEQLDLTGIFRTLHPKKENKTQTTHSFTHDTVSRIDHIAGHKTNLNKFKETEVILSIFSDHNSMKLEINHRKRKEKKNYYTEIKQHATKKKPNGSTMKSKRKIKNTLRQMAMKTKPYKIYGCSKSSS